MSANLHYVSIAYIVHNIDERYVALAQANNNPTAESDIQDIEPGFRLPGLAAIANPTAGLFETTAPAHPLATSMLSLNLNNSAASSAPVSLGTLAEGSPLTSARGNSWSPLNFQDLVKFG